MLDVICAIGIGIGLSVHSFGCWPIYLSTHQTLMVSTHFQTNSPGDWSQTCWIHSSWYSADLVDFWSCSAASQPFSGLRFVDMISISCICCGDLHDLPCGDFKDGRHQLCLVALGLPRELDLWCKMRETSNSKCLTLLIIDWFYHWNFISQYFFIENYFAVCIVISKYFLICRK